VIAAPCEPFVTGGIMFLSAVVAPAVCFDHEFRFGTMEVGDISIQYGLSPEFVAAAPPVTQMIPQALFHRSQGAAKLAGAFQ